VKGLLGWPLVAVLFTLAWVGVNVYLALTGYR
jgi:hypothetical protein